MIRGFGLVTLAKRGVLSVANTLTHIFDRVTAKKKPVCMQHSDDQWRLYEPINWYISWIGIEVIPTSYKRRALYSSSPHENYVCHIIQFSGFNKKVFKYNGAYQWHVPPRSNEFPEYKVDLGNTGTLHTALLRRAPTDGIYHHLPYDGCANRFETRLTLLGISYTCIEFW